MGILIKNGTLIDPLNGLDGEMDVYIGDDGRVAAVSPGIPEGAARAQTIDAAGMWVVPGLIDLHVHLREPGFEHKETIATGAKSAAAGGFTTICAMPNTNPVADTAKTIRYVIDRAKDANGAKVLPVGSITIGQEGRELADFARLKEAGACALSEDGKSVMDGALMERAFAEAQRLGLPILSHCEDPAFVKGGVMNDGAVSAALKLPGISRLSEESVIARDIALARKTGGRLHVCHVSTAGGTALVREARLAGLDVTAEVCPHHFTLTENDILASNGMDTNLKMNPPLRARSDVSALIDALRDGAVTVIATDHAPHRADEKEGGFLRAANGVVGLETAVPLALTHLVHSGALSRSALIATLTANPAAVLGIDRGHLSVGAVADVTLIAPGEPVTVDAAAFRSKSRNSPFHGWQLKGAVKLTIVHGRIVYDNR